MGWNTTRAKIEIVVDSAETRKMKDCRHQMSCSLFFQWKFEVGLPRISDYQIICKQRMSLFRGPRVQRDPISLPLNRHAHMIHRHDCHQHLRRICECELVDQDPPYLCGYISSGIIRGVSSQLTCLCSVICGTSCRWA